jgi:hypothetical protein
MLHLTFLKRVVDRRHAYESCEKRTIQKGIEMRKKWTVKVAHPM